MTKLETKRFKADLIQSINKTEDPMLLKEVGVLLVQSSEQYIELNQEQWDDIDLAIREVERGEYMSNEEAKALSKKWQED